MPNFENIREGQFRKVVGPGDVENRIMSSYDVVWQSIAELHGEGVVGDVLMAVQIDEFFDGDPTYIGKIALEAGVGYVNGKRISKLSQYINIPTPYRTVSNEVLIQQEEDEMQYVWVCQYPPLLDDSAIVLKRINGTTGYEETLTRYSDYTINPDTGVVTIDDSITLNVDDQLKLSYRSRIPMIWWVELHQGGSIYLHAGSTSATPPTTDTYLQSAYNGLYAIPPSVATDDTIVLAEIYVPGHVPSNGIANIDEDENRGIAGLSTSQIASGDYGVISDMRTILRSAEEILQFQEEFYKMRSDMEEAAEKSETAINEVRIHDAEFESEGIKKTSWSDTLGLYRGLRVEGAAEGFGSSELAEGDQSLSVLPGVCYIAQTIGSTVFLMRVPVAAQEVVVDAVEDNAIENRDVRESHEYQSVQALYELGVTPVTSIQNIKGEIHYNYVFSRTDVTTPFSYSSAFSGGLPTANPGQTSPPFEATLTEFTSAQLQQILTANGVAVETQSSVEANQYAQQVFAIEHSDIDKLHTLSIRWDGYGDQYDGADHHYGATLYIWNDTDDVWEALGVVNGGAIGTVQVTLTSNLPDYFVSDEKIYLLAATNTPADGTQAAQLWTDYVRVDAYVGRYVSSDHTQAADFPIDSYQQTSDQVEWISGKFLPVNASSFWVEYRTPLLRYDLVQIGLDGNVEVKKGTPSTSPVVPTVDDEHLPLAHVYVQGNLVIKNQEDAVSGSNGIIYDDRIFIWTGEEGIEAREDEDTLLQNLVNRTRETSPNPNFVVSGLEVQPYPDAQGSEYLQITDGIFYCEGNRITVSGLSPYEFNFSTLDLNTHRKDIITINASKSITQYLGTPALLQNAAALPEIPTDEVPLAYIEVTGQMVQDNIVLGSAISNTESGADISDALRQRLSELEGNGVLFDDITVAPTSPRSQSVELAISGPGILYIDGRRVVVTSGEGSIQPMSPVQYSWEESTSFHPFQSGLTQGEETEWFNIDSVLSPPMEMPLESVHEITAQALCDHQFRRPHGSQYTHQAYHISYPGLDIDPTLVPSGTPAAATEFTDDGFDASNMPVYNDNYNTYQNLMFSDGVRAEKEGSPTTGHYAQHLFKFKHVTNKGSITKYEIIWHGQGHRYNITGTTTYSAALQIWNATDEVWVDLVDSDSNESGSEDSMILTATITSSLSKYRGENGDIWIRAYCPLPSADGYGASIITDYIECQITENNRLMVGNKIRNSDFEYGLDRPYDWNIIGNGTVTWLTDSDAIVNQSCFYKYYPYVWHEFCSQDTIGDAYANDPRTRSLRISSDGTQNIKVQQRFNIGQGEVRPFRFSAWVKGNIDDSEGETPNCAITIELWDEDNSQAHVESIVLPVGEYDWTEVKRDFITSDIISYGRVTLSILGVSGWAAFDRVTLTEVPDGHLVYDEELEVSDILEHDIEIDYQPNMDYIDWSPSGFAPVEGTEYSAYISAWPVRIDSCQINTGGNFTVYTGEEGQDEYGPEQQALSHVIADIFVRGDRPIVAEDDGFNSYIINKAVKEFTGTEGIEQRDEIANITTQLGRRYMQDLQWGLETTKLNTTTLKITPGEIVVKGVHVLSPLYQTISGSGAMESGWYYLSASKNAYGGMSLSLSPVGSGWPDAVVIAKVYWTKSGDSGSFGTPQDQRQLSRAPSTADAVERAVRNIMRQQYAVDVYDFSQGALPTPPVLLSPLSGDQKLIISWEPTTDPTVVGYQVYRASTKSGTYTAIGSVDKHTTVYTDSGLTNDITYWYKVASINAQGAESNIALLTDAVSNDYSQPQNGSPLATAAPIAPTNLVAAAGVNSVTLNWDNVTRTVAGDTIAPCNYVVYRSCVQLGGGANGPWQRVNNQLLSSSNYTDTNLRNGYTFYYRVVAVREEGVSSALSQAVFATPTAARASATPATPTNVVAQRGCSWSSDEDFDAMSYVDNCMVAVKEETGSMTIDSSGTVTTLSAWDINVALGFLPQTLSLEIDGIVGGDHGYDAYYYGTYLPTFHNTMWDMTGNRRYEEKDFGLYNGAWVVDENTGAKVDTTFTATLLHTPIKEGSISATVSGSDALLTLSEVDYETGEITLSGGDNGPVLVTYQVQHDREMTTDYKLGTCVGVMNITNGEELSEGTDYTVVGNHILFESSQQGVVGVIYTIDVANDSRVYAVVNQVTHEGFSVSALPPEGCEMTLAWRATGSALRVATPDTYYGYGIYGYTGFEALAEEQGTARYIGDSNIAGATWDNALIIANIPTGTSATFRFRTASDRGGLAAASWSAAQSIADGRQVLAVNSAGRFIEIEFAMTAVESSGVWSSPCINFCYCSTKETMIQWDEVEEDISGNECAVSGYRVYRRSTGGTPVARDVGTNSYVYRP
jgi:hypothetical protein